MITLTETLIILHITKTESNNCFIKHFKWGKPKTKAENNKHARKTIKNKSRRLNMQITELSVSQ